MQVHELARRAGVSGHAVRYYHSLGLLKPARDPENGYRRFDVGALQRLRFIHSAKSLGFTLAEIREILKTSQAGDSPCPAVREVVSRRIKENAARIRALAALQGRLESAARRWAHMPNRVPDGHAVCHLIESFGEEA
ncbi:MAG TPA: MerR family transcriptional regulator [Burkholderiales bacterium]|nr:MerR family transcriptional regulator [Burkholderiales bacterium]